MAGNIIHAIATTNAIISGLIVIEAIKILAGMCNAHLNHFSSGMCHIIIWDVQYGKISVIYGLRV
jgi:hypothetical protein